MERTPPGRAREWQEASWARLLHSALDGNTADYAVFLRDLAVALRGFYRNRLFRFAAEQEDLVQETLIAVHNQRHTYDPALPVSAWVYAIARYKLADLLRRRGAKDRVTDGLDAAEELLVAAETEACDAERDLSQLLAVLPDHQRLPIIYTKLEGLSVAEAAQRLECSESAVKVGVHRGLKALAARIREDVSEPKN